MLVPGAFSVFPTGGARPFVKPFGSPSTAACCSSFVVMLEEVEASLALAASPVAAVEEDTGRVGAPFWRVGSKVLLKWVPGPVSAEDSGSLIGTK